MKIAIIGGAGKMGRWLANFMIKDGKEVIVADRDCQKLQEIKQSLKVDVQDNINAVKLADVIVISVMISDFEEVIREISPYIKPDQIVCEIASLKVHPLDVLHKYIKDVPVLGVHPMFGPGTEDIKNQTFILTPTTDKEISLARKVENYLTDKGATIEYMSPQEHDELMTLVLGLTHFIAVVSADTFLSTDQLRKANLFGGTSYKNLWKLMETIVAEDAELFSLLQINLPNMVETEMLFAEKVNNWVELIKEGNRQKISSRIKDFRKEFLKTNV